MSHLPIERLADLADSEPTLSEREHLRECTMCASELAAYRRLVAIATDEHRRIAPPLTSWGALRTQLRREGAITRPITLDPSRTATARLVRGVQRAAAAVVLIVGGTMFGRFSAGLSAREAVAVGDLRFAEGLRSPDSASSLLAGQDFASASDAVATLERTQREYDRAVQYLTTHDTSSSEAAPDQYRARLAVVDHIADYSLRALRDAPQDPVINQLYLSTLGARDMTLNKLGTVLPVGARLTKF
jgi:hypothetical protein